MEDFERRRKMKLRMFILLDLIIIIIVGVVIFDKDNKVVEDIKNYVTTTFANTSKEQVDSNVGTVLLEKSKMESTNGISKLTTKVTNNSVEKDNFRFKVKFIAADGSTISELSVYVGAIKANETKYMVSYITADVSKAKNIIYEIL